LELDPKEMATTTTTPYLESKNSELAAGEDEIEDNSVAVAAVFSAGAVSKDTMLGTDQD
jgi:hypothetical protein